MDQEEHGVDPQAEGEEGDDLGGGGVEVDPDEGGQAEAGTDVHRHQEDSSQAQASLGPHAVRPAVERGSSVDELGGNSSVSVSLYHQLIIYSP